MTEACLVHGADTVRLADAFWHALREDDPTLPSLRPEGAGECRGEGLLVNWIRSSRDPCFACQVFALDGSRAWEAGIADTGRDLPTAFWRPLWGDVAPAPRAWAVAIDGPHALEPVSPHGTPTFLAISQIMATRGMPIFNDDSAVRRALEEDLAYWRDLAKAQADVHRRTRAALKARERAAIPAAPAIDGAADAQATTTPQWALDRLDEWAAENSDRIIVMPRAIAAARKSNYHAPEHVFDALEMLADIYPAVKKGQMERDALLRRCEELGLSIGKSGEAREARTPDEYFVRWRGERKFLEFHLGRGNARDPRYSMRIYFAWCDTEEAVIVGWLPSHLQAAGA